MLHQYNNKHNKGLLCLTDTSLYIYINITFYMYKRDEKYGIGIAHVQGIIRLGMSPCIGHLHNLCLTARRHSGRVVYLGNWCQQVRPVGKSVSVKIRSVIRCMSVKVVHR